MEAQSLHISARSPKMVGIQEGGWNARSTYIPAGVAPISSGVAPYLLGGSSVECAQRLLSTGFVDALNMLSKNGGFPLLATETSAFRRSSARFQTLL